MAGFPWSAVAAFVFIYALVLTYSLSRTHPVLRRLYGGEACIVTITAALLMTVFFGFAGFHRTWFYYVTMLALTFCMGLCLADGLCHVRQRRPASTLAHLSVFIVLFAGLFGGADKRSVNLEAHLDKPVSVAFGRDGRMEHLPFTLTLESFTIDNYPPKVMPDGGEGWDIAVLEEYDMAMPVEGGFRELNHVGAEPAAFVRATNRESGECVEGWVSCGGFMFSPVNLSLPDGQEVYMPRPTPKKYESKVRAVDADGNEYRFDITVNHPARIGKWRIYQADYDSVRGRWSDYSVLQCVHDPWFPIIGTGLWMVLAAALLMLVDAAQRALRTFLRERRRPSAVVSASAAGILLFSVALMCYYLRARELMPALQSPWFVPHVAVYMVAYAVLAAAVLLRRRDALVRIGWAFLSAGMVMGALWAKQAWGDWWSWDPKETWALATWLSYMLYLHAKPCVKDRRLMYALLVLSFLMLCMCWFGINILPAATSSIHVY